MSYYNNDRYEQTHVHEVQGSLQIAEREDDPHNHRFATVTDEVIPCGRDNHVHNIVFRTDFYENHFHTFCGKTCPAIRVGDRHVHFLKDVTSFNDGHRHDFRLATFIEDPIGEED
ncbi:MAG: YmaF family protein [Tissierellia bacterium]|nr:YmaF family protein [Tissierellia bacterium]